MYCAPSTVTAAMYLVSWPEPSLATLYWAAASPRAPRCASSCAWQDRAPAPVEVSERAGAGAGRRWGKCSLSRAVGVRPFMVRRREAWKTGNKALEKGLFPRPASDFGFYMVFMKVTRDREKNHEYRDCCPF